MSEDPGESFVIQTVLRATPASEAPAPQTSRAARFTPRLGAGDDAAWVGPDLVVSTDTMVEGVHFDHRLSPEDVGWKLVAVNASDIGAMGCRPTWALLTLSLPRPLDPGWVQRFSAGLHQALDRYGVALVGGDTTASPGPIVAGLTIAGVGAVPVLRSGGRAGDDLWVTGALGEAAAGFLDGAPSGLDALRRPQPPVELGAALGDAGLATAMMDLSDGLATDLARLCAASGLGAEVWPEALPAGPALTDHPAALARQVAFGDDYELLFAAAPGSAAAIQALAQQQGVRVTRIGRLDAGPAARLRGQEWPAADFTHFGGPA